MSCFRIFLKFVISSMCSFQGAFTGTFLYPNGDGEIRTLDPLLARQVLSQLSYAPTDCSIFNGLKWTRTIDLTLIRRAL